MPSNFSYMNQSAPFWDFLASLEQQGSQHPFFNQNNPANSNNNQHDRGEDHHGPPSLFDPWSWGHQMFGGPRGMPYRGPPPQGHSPDDHEEEIGKNEKGDEQQNTRDVNMAEDNGEGPSGVSGSDNEGHVRGHGRRCGGRRGRCGPGGRGGFGGRWEHGPRGHGLRHESPHQGPGHHHGPPHGRRGPRGPWGRGGPFGAFGGPGGVMFDPSVLATQFWNQFNENHPSSKKDNNEDQDFSPEADIFDTESAFVVHVSLPGAKKEDVGVNWDIEKSELSVAGVIYRPGNEDFLKTLAMDERKVGPFERKIRLGTRASPAHIDADGISAKLEDGVLRIEVPKMDGGFVEIKKVDIE